MGNCFWDSSRNCINFNGPEINEEKKVSEAKGPYCKRIGDSEIRFRNRIEKFVYEIASTDMIDEQVELINRAHEDGIKEGRASRDGLRKAAERIVKRWNTCGLGLGDEELIRVLEKALEADGEGE